MFTRPLVFLLVLPIAARAQCPTNHLRSYSNPVVESNASSYELPLGEDFGEPVHLGYDLATGTLHEHSFAGLGSSSWVRTSDLYDVVGVSPGSMVVATASLTVENAWVGTVGCGGTGCWGFVVARIVAGTDSTANTAGINVYSPGTKSLEPFSASLGVTFTAGTPVSLTFRLEGHQTAGGSHATDADAVIAFSGLPPGVHVVSCQGYVDPSTPALPMSWGRVKAAYR